MKFCGAASASTDPCDDVFEVFAQIFREIRPKTNFEIYIGAENLNNKQQVRPIISADEPFSLNFDSSLVYAPVFGRMMYVGFRYNL